MKKQLFNRWLIYLMGLAFLAMGIMLNTKTGMGVSAVVAAPYSISALFGLNFGNTTLVFYILMFFGQVLLKKRDTRPVDFLQIPMSVLFTRLLNLLAALLPSPSALLPRVLFLILAVVCTGIGAAMSLNMRLIPNSADGIVQVLSDVTGREMGFCKNCFDGTCLLFALTAGVLVGHRVTGIGVGLGTLASMLGIGRVIAVFNGLCKTRILCAAGLER